LARRWFCRPDLAHHHRGSFSAVIQTETKIMPALNASEIELHLKAVPDWTKQAQTICRTFNFEGFMTSVDFVRRIAKQTLKINHNPDIEINSDKVTLTLTTHDEGGLTEKDFSLARKCDEVFARFLEA
jgi:4a-hydroxytetrahydrobiopterin dehydratase